MDFCMSFLNLLESVGKFYLPAIANVSIGDKGNKKITVRTRLKLPYIKENTDEVGSTDGFSLFGLNNIELKSGDLVKVEALKGLPFLIEKMRNTDALGQGVTHYKTPSVRFHYKISNDEYNKINECFIELSRLLSESSLNSISHLNEDDAFKNIERIIDLFNDSKEWHKIPPNALYSLIGSLKDGKSFNILLNSLKIKNETADGCLSAIKEKQQQIDDWYHNAESNHQKIIDSVKQLDTEKALYIESMQAQVKAFKENTESIQTQKQKIEEIASEFTAKITEQEECYTQRLSDLHGRELKSKIIEAKIAPVADLLKRTGQYPKFENKEIIFDELSGDKFRAALHYPSSDLVEKAFQLALMSAVIRGRLILLEGSVGVGKTHLAESFAKRLGGKCATIPVRPSWADSSDLFGFFDPLSKVFRPAAFTEALAQDQEPVYQDSKRPIYPVILDEMNLARIENYGADLLSRVEKIAEYKIKPEKDRQEGDDSYLLKVWSAFEYLSLKEEREFIQKMAVKKPENKRRLSELNFLDVYTPKMSLPEGFVLMGTLNADESTFEISPKVIDRSFVITFPNFDGQQTNIADFLYNFNVSEFREKFIKGNVNNTKHQKKWEIFYKKIKLIDELGIPISYRIYNDYCDMMVFFDLELISRKDEKEYEQAFIWSRIIPRISFFKDQDAKKAALNKLLALLSNNKSDLAWKGIEDKLKKQITDDNVSMVKFFGR